MSETVDALIGDMIVWLDAAERPYPEVMEAWRTSCPRLPIWEDATDRGLVALRRVGGTMLVAVTAAGRAFAAGRH